MSAIAINITRNVGGDTVCFAAQADSASAALILVAELTGKDAPAPTITDKVIADAKKPTAATASSLNGAKPEATGQKGTAREAINEALDKARAGKPESKAKGEEEQAAPTYEDVKAKILPLAQAKGRDTVVALLQRHGVTKAPDLKPAQWAAVIADIDAIEAGTYDPEASEALA